MTPPRKKLIEVALPLEAINREAAREKSIRHGHPSTLHLWWARRPLAAARAVIFAQMVDDPDSDPAYRKPDGSLDEDRAGMKRAQLFNLIEELVKWENTNNDQVINAARAEIARCVAGYKIEQGELQKATIVWRQKAGDRRQEKADLEHTDPCIPTAGSSAKGQLHPKGPLPQDGQSATAWEIVIMRAKPEAVNTFLAEHAPPFHDPFAGGGALPLEAQRLGLVAHASDLNPVAVMINKAMIEIPPRFADQPPVNPEARTKYLGTRAPWPHLGTRAPACPRNAGRSRPHREEEEEAGVPPAIPGFWRGATGLAEDVRYYGQWMRDEAEKRIGHLYPKVKITSEMAKDRPDLKPYVGKELIVIAWLWARTVETSNPAYRGCHVPLVSTFWLSTKPGKEAWVEPVIEGKSYRFEVRVGKPHDKAAIDGGTKLSRGANFRCLLSQSPLSPDYIKAEGKAGRMGARLMAIVCEGDRGRVYLPPTEEHEAVAREAKPVWKPENELVGKCRDQLPLYGINTFADIFTPRQLVALTTFSDLVAEAREKIAKDASAAGLLADDDHALRDGGAGPHAYAEAVSVYLGFCLDKATLTNTTQATWQKDPDRLTQAFGRQALPMVWDFAEANPLSEAGGGFGITAHAVGKVLDRLPIDAPDGMAYQQDAQQNGCLTNEIISTDPPYYDNISYSDISDYFYVWLRRVLQPFFPELFGTMLVPKDQELIASSYRHSSKEAAEQFFLQGMTRAMHAMASRAHSISPVTIYYAFKQSETNDNTTASTGWETFLAAVITAGFSICGTWPMRTELIGNLKKNLSALASSIVLVCRPRPADAPMTTRKDFLAALRRELPPAVRAMQGLGTRASCPHRKDAGGTPALPGAGEAPALPGAGGTCLRSADRQAPALPGVAPVDLAQASIGPGMAVFSHYSRILETDGKPMTVRTALQLINQTLDETLAEQEGDFDTETTWAVAWFEQFAFNDGPFGDAETLSKAKNTGLNALTTAGIVKTGAGKARLLRVDELPKDWDPTTDQRLTVWEMAHHLIRVMSSGGETAAAELLAKLGGAADAARELAYRLYSVCERRKRATEALAYNALVQSWPEIARLAREVASRSKLPEQGKLL